jgi:drug/metabolite transporter (DMT)-like permease
VSGRQAGLLTALAAIWGGSYLLIKVALEDLGPAVIVCARCALAAIVLFAVMRLSGGGQSARAALADVRARPRWALLHGLLAVALPFSLISFGELAVPSGLTAVLIAPVSLWVAGLAPLLDPSEGVDRRAAIGMAAGLAGVALVVGVESVHSVGEFLGALAILGASASYGLSGFVVKRRYNALPPIATSFIAITVATLLTLPLAAATAPGDVPGLLAVGAVLTLGVLGTALAFVILYVLIGEVGARRAQLVSYLAPGFALVYGAALLGEPITVAAVAGLALILTGVALASRGPAEAAPASVAPATCEFPAAETR